MVLRFYFPHHNCCFPTDFPGDGPTKEGKTQEIEETRQRRPAEALAIAEGYGNTKANRGVEEITNPSRTAESAEQGESRSDEEKGKPTWRETEFASYQEEILVVHDEPSLR